MAGISEASVVCRFASILALYNMFFIGIWEAREIHYLHTGVIEQILTGKIPIDQ